MRNVTIIIKWQSDIDDELCPMRGVAWPVVGVILPSHLRVPVKLRSALEQEQSSLRWRRWVVA